MNVNINMDERTIEAMREMPKNVSASRVLRHVMRAFSYNEEEWSEYAKTAECKELRAFLKPYKQRLGIG